MLADGLSLAVEEEPDAIIDLATLTGACVVALGRRIAGLMGNDDRLVSAVQAASERAGEPTWQLPLPEAYRAGHRLGGRRHEEPLASRGAEALSRPASCSRSSSRTGPGSTSTSPARRVRTRTRARSARVRPGSGCARLLELLGTYEPLGSPAAGAAGGKVVP